MPERAGQQSGADLKRQDLPVGVFTPIFWYASYPNHYQGDAAGANAASPADRWLLWGGGHRGQPCHPWRGGTDIALTPR